MELPKRPFKKPIPCARLLALRVTKWPSKNRWAYVPNGTERIERATPVTLLSFPEPSSRDASPEERDRAEEVVAKAVRKAGLVRFLTSDHLKDILASLKREIAGAKTAEDKRLLKENHEDLVYRAITKYWRDDAFLSVYGWTTRRGTVAGVIDAYRAPDLEKSAKRPVRR